MWEKLLLAIGLTFTLHLCTQTGLFSLSQTTQENMQTETWVLLHNNTRTEYKL